MKPFSERYGYVEPSEVIIREKLTKELENAICSTYDLLQEKLSIYNRYLDYYEKLELHLWLYFLNNRRRSFYSYGTHKVVAVRCVLDPNLEWYKKLDLIEVTIGFLNQIADVEVVNNVKFFISRLNSEFERLNFGYRIIDNLVTKITDELQIETISKAINEPTIHESIKTHLSNALSLYAQRPEGDYRNSIKESISAVEVFCRDLTGEKTLGKALSSFEKKGVSIPFLLKEAFQKLYNYTNQPDTGIRHALMDVEKNNTPQQEDALFMLVSCSSFINYMNAKMSRNK